MPWFKGQIRPFAGWVGSQTYVNNQSTFVQVGWTRRLDNGSIAKGQLSNAVPDQSPAMPRWDLLSQHRRSDLKRPAADL